MLKNNYIKVGVILGAIVLVISFTFSSLELKNPVSGKVPDLLNTENKLESSADDASESGSEVYFSIFKFIGNLSPIKSNN